METQQLHNILESCLLVAGKAMSLAQLETLFDEDIDRPERSEIKEALVGLQASYEGRGIELVEVSSGWRLQSAESMQHWIARMFEERPPRYSRALLETLVLIAYRQPITRGEIEEVRGVAVSSNIIRTLQEREWIKEMGFKDVPGKPALWGTTKAFLDYFNLKQLDELPTLAEARDLAEIDAALAAELGVVEGADDAVAANDEQGDDDGQQEGEQGEGVEGENTDGVEADSADADGEGIEGEGAEVYSADSESADAESAEGESVEANSEAGESADAESAESESTDGENTDDHNADSANVEDASAEDVSAENNHSVAPEGEQSEGSLESPSASLEGENSNAYESGLTDLANKLHSDNDGTDEPELANVEVGLEAEAAVVDEPNLAELADGIDTEANAMDETQLADLAGYLENQLVNRDEPKLADLSVGLEADSGDADETNLTDLASSLETESGEPTLSDAANLFEETFEATDSSDLELGEGTVDDSTEQTHSADPSADDDVAQSVKERPVVEAAEISAFDLDIEQWPERKEAPVDVAQDSSHPTDSVNEGQSEDGVEPATSNDSNGSANSDSVDGAAPTHGEAEADLRRVIDDFAEEHQKQLDDRDLHRAELNERHSSGPKPAFENNASKVTAEPVDDGQSGSSENLNGWHNSTDAELTVTDQDLPDQEGNSDNGTTANSGEP